MFHVRAGACQRAVNRGFYLVLKTALSSRHQLRCILTGEGGTSSLRFDKISGRVKKRKVFANRLPESKISPAFSKAADSKDSVFGRSAHGAKSLFPQSAGGEQKYSGGIFLCGEPSPGVPRCAPGTPNRGFYLVLKTALSSRHRLRCILTGEGGTSPLRFDKIFGRVKKAGHLQAVCPKVNFRPPFQRRWNPKVKPLVAPRTERNLFLYISAGGETKQSGRLFWRGEPSPGVPRIAQIARFYLDSFSPVTTFIVRLRHAPPCTESRR